MKLFSQNPTHRANLSRTGFDMSHNVKFTSAPGQLLPVMYDFLIAGDNVKVSESMFSRTNTLRTSAFVDIKEHIDYFFVPMQLIWSLYPTWRFSVGQPTSSIFDNQANNEYFPQFRMGTLYKLTSYDYFPGPQGDIQYPYVVDNISMATSFEKAWYLGALRLRNMLGLGFDSQFDFARNPEFPFNPFLLCAYQKIYYDYYCLTDRESVQRVSYNLDAWYNQNYHYDQNGDIINASSYGSDMERALRFMLNLHYVPWKKDYFMGMQVSPLENYNMPNTDFFGQNLTQITDYISSVTPNVVSSQPSSSQDTQPNTQVGANYNYGNVSAQYVLNYTQNRLTTGFIRKMFAQEKLLSITRRSKDDYASLVAAHFGVDVSPFLAEKVLYLGGTSNQIQINEVAGTVNNDETALGELAGRGAGYKDNKGNTVEFTAPCDGVLMAITYARPELDYKSIGLDRINMWSLPSDLYTPEYANLGYQPVFNYEVHLDMSDDENTPYDVKGWSYRYSQFKSKQDKVYNGFVNDALSDWTVSFKFGASDFGNNTASYYVNPSCLDPIMLESYHGGNISMQDWNFSFDPLLHWFRFDYFKVSVMDAYGLPQL